MYKGIHNYSEIGTLKKVLVHKPGAELEALTPDTLGKLLFEDIPFLTVAQKEHDAFAKLLKDNGVKVAYIVDEAAKVMEDPRVRSSYGLLHGHGTRCNDQEGHRRNQTF